MESKWVVIRLSNQSTALANQIDKASKATESVQIDLLLDCKQVHSTWEGAYCWVWLGASDKKGGKTAWNKGLRALGTVTSITGGPNFKDSWTVKFQIRVVLEASIDKVDLLRAGGEEYSRFCNMPIVGITSDASQTVQEIESDPRDSNLQALLNSVARIDGGFEEAVVAVYPELEPMFDYAPLLVVGEGTPSVVEEAVPRNLILSGPPATGKSYHVKHVLLPRIFQGKALAADEIRRRTFRVTFHPEYTFHDFVGSYQPTVAWLDHEGALSRHEPEEAKRRPVTFYEFVPGPLARALVQASQEPELPVVLVIEELNRGNCAAIFGDIFQLLDRPDGRSEYPIRPTPDFREWLERQKVTHPGLVEIFEDGELFLPENLYLIATMNTADQSLFPIDSAFRRRWKRKYRGVEAVAADNAGTQLPTVPVGGKKYVPWLEFTSRINEQVRRLSRNIDKQLGPFKFCVGGEIPDEDFLHSVVHDLWTDVFKTEQARRAVFDLGDGGDYNNLEALLRRHAEHCIFRDFTDPAPSSPELPPAEGNTAR